ncbi:hypothetical protein Salat_2528300 [Sesamum alatum]|uniref:Uncharacterized protein n=1 Tax=Sesamum alatum TaxID=300844 RepID=A0AAE1XT09_9LAMI|nr:hypothetical protein Salat_2528300 [Sesamum alatum]
MADPHPPQPHSPILNPLLIPAKKSYSSIVQHPTASHFQHDPERAAKKSFHNEDLLQMGMVTRHKGDPDKDWDEEFARHRRSPNDKAAHFDIASSKPGNEGEKPKEQEYTHCSNIHKQLPFTPAWSLEECESNLMETHKEGTRSTLYKGDTSTPHIIGSQETEVASDGEDEATPIFNRFQSLQNFEEEEIQTNGRQLQPHTEGNINASEAGDTDQHNQTNQPQAAQQADDTSFEISQTTTHNLL